MARCDKGSITGFVVVIMLAVMCCAGLVIDGARIVGAKISAADHAENAARAGAQEIRIVRDGQYVIDEGPARQAAAAYLAAHGISGSVEATSTNVSVTVSNTVETTLLALVGVDAKSVQATRSAAAVSE